MNIDEMIAVLREAKAGKKIQYRRYIDLDRGWSLCIGAPLWNFNQVEYRVPPEPREIWVPDSQVPTWRDGNYGYDMRHAISREECLAHWTDPNPICLREVIEGEK